MTEEPKRAEAQTVIADLGHIGYTHASLIADLRPDSAYPNLKVRQAKSVLSTVTAAPCSCPDEHVEVWLRHAT
jgi:hypothetical protein